MSASKPHLGNLNTLAAVVKGPAIGDGRGVCVQVTRDVDLLQPGSAVVGHEGVTTHRCVCREAIAMFSPDWLNTWRWWLGNGSFVIIF